MKKIYEKLEIPLASDDLEERIIAAANAPTRKHLIPRLAMVAACLLITLSVINPDEKSIVTNKNILADIQFFDDQYGFDKDIS